MTAAGPPRSAPGRSLRTAVTAGSAVALAVAAHAAQDGCVAYRGAALILGLCAPSAWLLTSRERTLATVLAWLAAVQVAAHVVLAALCGGGVLVSRPGVLVAHVGAVVLTALVLRAADARAWARQAVARVCRSVLARLAPPLVVAPGTTQPDEAFLGWVPAPWSDPSPVRRGPPLWTAVSP